MAVLGLVSGCRCRAASTWQCLSVVEKPALAEDALIERALDAGADAVHTEGEAYEVLTPPTQLEVVKDALATAGVPVHHSELTRIATLADLPFRANWRRRIRSAHVGPTASVILWDNEQFQGVSRRLLAQAKHAVLDELSGRVESLVVDCPP